MVDCPTSPTSVCHRPNSKISDLILINDNLSNRNSIDFNDDRTLGAGCDLEGEVQECVVWHTSSPYIEKLQNNQEETGID